MKPTDRPSPRRGARDRFAELDALGLDALTFLAADEDRLGDFLAAAGISQVNLRDAAAEPGFLRGVLSHMATDETLLVAFASQLGRRPEDIGATIARCAGDEWDV